MEPAPATAAGLGHPIFGGGADRTTQTPGITPLSWGAAPVPAGRIATCWRHGAVLFRTFRCAALLATAILAAIFTTAAAFQG